MPFLSPTSVKSLDGWLVRIYRFFQITEELKALIPTTEIRPLIHKLPTERDVVMSNSLYAGSDTSILAQYDLSTILLSSLVVRALDLQLDGCGFNSLPFLASATETGMGGHLRAGKPPQYFTKPLMPTQPDTLNGMGNEYQPKCSDALQLAVQGRYRSFHLWINVWVVGKTV